MKTLLKKLISKIGNGVLISVWFALGIWIIGLVYSWNNAMTQVWTGSGLTATAWNAMVNNINELNTTKLATNWNGSQLTALNGSQVTTWTVPVARLWWWTPSSSTYLRWDGTWSTVSSSDCNWVDIWTSCWGWKYAGGWIVAALSDLSMTSNWKTAVTNCLNKTDWWFKDWRLPTLDEVYMLYVNYVAIWGFSTANAYWSWTMSTDPNSWRIAFSNGIAYSNDRTTTFSVRCVRKF